jgi:hypothetical protein
MATHMRYASDALSLPFMTEGVDEMGGLGESHAEFRFSGPFVTTSEGGHYHLKMIGNILLTSYMDLDAGAYSIFEWAGEFQRAMLGPIPIYKYGVGGELLGCLELLEDKDDSVKIFHFGQISPVERIRQSEVDALYQMDFTI